MRNGVYLVLIIFLGSVGFYAVNALYIAGNMLIAGTVFFLLSIGIFFLTTHFKKRINMEPIQKVINIVYITLFALYGVILGLKLMSGPVVAMSSVKFEGGLFLIASGVLLYGIYEFMKRKVIHH